MIAPPANTRVWIAAGVTDLRRGFTGLSALVQTELEQSPFSGHVFVFRGRRGDLIKVLWFDGDGLVSVRQAAGAGTFRVAASGERHGVADAGAVIDAAGRHRLAAAGADAGIRSCRCNGEVTFHRIFLRERIARAKIHAILRACQPRRFRI